VAPRRPAVLGQSGIILMPRFSVTRDSTKPEMRRQPAARISPPRLPLILPLWAVAPFLTRRGRGIFRKSPSEGWCGPSARITSWYPSTRLFAEATAGAISIQCSIRIQEISDRFRSSVDRGAACYFLERSTSSRARNTLSGIDLPVLQSSVTDGGRGVFLIAQMLLIAAASAAAMKGVRCFEYSSTTVRQAGDEQLLLALCGQRRISPIYTRFSINPWRYNRGPPQSNSFFGANGVPLFRPHPAGPRLITTTACNNKLVRPSMSSAVFPGGPANNAIIFPGRTRHPNTQPNRQSQFSPTDDSMFFSDWVAAVPEWTWLATFDRYLEQPSLPNRQTGFFERGARGRAGGGRAVLTLPGKRGAEHRGNVVDQKSRIGGRPNPSHIQACMPSETSGRLKFLLGGRLPPSWVGPRRWWRATVRYKKRGPPKEARSPAVLEMCYETT